MFISYSQLSYVNSLQLNHLGLFLTVKSVMLIPYS